jgi:hypothetical protein
MYGRKYMGTARTTFILDEAGRISRVIDKVDTRNHTEQILGGDAPAPMKSTKKAKGKRPSRKRPSVRKK